MGAIKDLFIRVESILHDRHLSVEERQRKSLALVLKSTRNIIQLSPWDRTIRLMKFYRKGACLTSALYFVPDNVQRRFYIQESVFPENVPDRVRDAYLIISQNHNPCFLDESEFERHKKLAKGNNPEGWQERFLNFAERSQFISVCGWIYEKKETLISRDADKCLAFDGSFIDKAKTIKGFSHKDKRWVDVKSFTGCIVNGPNGRVAGVLLVMKNIRGGLVPEDLEITIIASQLMGRILQFKE
jgi:hypothetical protein